MDLKGERVIKSTPERLYEVLTDPKALIRAMPGLKTLEEESPGVYRAELEMGVAAIRGKYQGEMRLVDQNPPHSYRMKMKGQGSTGFVEIDLGTALEQTEAGTRLSYDGVAQVGGKVAGVGQRLLSGVATLILNQFFGAIEKIAANP